MTRNRILWWVSISGDLEGVEYLVITYTVKVYSEQEL